jgi:phosphonate transport system substrate-binding protein
MKRKTAVAPIGWRASRPAIPAGLVSRTRRVVFVRGRSPSWRRPDRLLARVVDWRDGSTGDASLSSSLEPRASSLRAGDARAGWLLACLLTLALAGCAQEREGIEPRYGAAPNGSPTPVYAFAVHPLHNPKKLMQAYQPLVDHLNSRVSEGRFLLEASRDYASFEEKFRSRRPGIILPNPWQTLQAMKVGYQVVATAGEPGDFRGLIVVRKDSGIHAPKDLLGKAVSYPAPTALAACIMPQAFLHRSGLNVSTDIANRYVGSQESSMMNVVLGHTAAGATWPPPWRAFQKDHPREAATLKVIWETEPLINNSVMTRDDLPGELRVLIGKHLTELHQTEEGRSILAGMETSRFLSASDRDYDVVRAYVERFEREVRKVETP